MNLMNLLFSIRVWWANNRRAVAITMAGVALFLVGVVGIFLMATKKEKPMVPVQVVISACDLKAKQVLNKEEVEGCLRKVTYMADPNALVQGLDPAQIQPVFRQLPLARQYRVSRDISKGMPLNGSEFEAYVSSDQYVLVQMERAYATSDQVVFRIRKPEIIAPILGANNNQTTALPAGFQLRIEGRCEAIVDNKCAFVVGKAEILDPDGNKVRDVAEETALAILQEVGASGLAINKASEVFAAPAETGENPSQVPPTPVPPPTNPEMLPTPQGGQ